MSNEAAEAGHAHACALADDSDTTRGFYAVAPLDSRGTYTKWYISAILFVSYPPLSSLTRASSASDFRIHFSMARSRSARHLR